MSQDDAAVTADVRGPDGPYRVTARYLVGCDGVRSRVRDMAGIAFPGITYPEVNRLGQFTMPDSVTLRATATTMSPASAGSARASPERSAAYSRSPRRPLRTIVGVYTSEEESTEYDDDTPMTVTELQDSVRRVLGA